MAHLRPLKADHRFGRSYAERLSEYVEFTISPMREKEFPEQLATIMRELRKRSRRRADARGDGCLRLRRLRTDRGTAIGDGACNVANAIQLRGLMSMT
jgi:hypothetical protein